MVPTLIFKLSEVVLLHNYHILQGMFQTNRKVNWMFTISFFKFYSGQVSAWSLPDHERCPKPSPIQIANGPHQAADAAEMVEVRDKPNTSRGSLKDHQDHGL